MFKDFLEDILRGNIKDYDVEDYKEEINNIKKDLDNLTKSKKNDELKYYIKKINYLLYGKDKDAQYNAQYDLDRMNAEISAYSSGDLPKYEYLTKKDLGYKPDAVEKLKFEYSPIGKVFTDGLAKEDKSNKVGLFKRLKNIEDNLVEVDDNDNKVGVFRIIKDIKDTGIKIDNNDEVVREIRERIKELRDDGVKVNNFDEMKKEL